MKTVRIAGQFEDLYPDHLTPRYLELHRLVETLRQMVLPEPLDALPDLIEMLDHSTGNSFLDVGELSLAEGGGYPPWNREDVEWLAEEWRKRNPSWSISTGYWTGKQHARRDWLQTHGRVCDVCWMPTSKR